MNLHQTKEEDKKFYTILLFIDNASSKQIERLRKEYIGTNLVDRHLPHISLKRKFTLTKNFSENSLIKEIKKFTLPPIKFSVIATARMGDALTLIGKSKKLTQAHTTLTEQLEGKTCTVNPEWEGNNFTPHLTIFRDPELKFSLSQKDIGVDTFFLDTLGVYEMDPNPAKRFSRELFLKKLNPFE